MPVPSGSRIFDGIDDQLVTAATLNLSSYTVLTFLCRFWWNTFSNSNNVLMMGDVGAFVINPNWDGGAFAAYMVTGGYNWRSVARPTAGAWHELAVVFNRPAAPAGEITIYLDGSAPSSTVVLSYDTTGAFGNQVLYLMSAGGTIGAGRLSDVAIYGSALTVGQITQYSEGTAGDGFGTPIAYWPLNGSGSTEPDATGHGHTLTVTGATAGGPPTHTLPTPVLGGPVVTIGGVTRTTSTRVYNEAVTIRDVLDHVPNTCELTVDGTEPPIGAEVKIGIGGVATLSELLFAGHVRQVRQVYEGQKAENVAWHVSCIDYTWLLNRRKVITQYPSQSATTTIVHLITNYTSGFTSVNVAAGLATLDPITFTNEEPADCLTRICKLLGAYWYVDYLKDVHVFLSESTDLPANITDANPQGAAAIESVEDLSQIRTRVYVEGGGATAARDAAVGDTILYVDDPSWYNASGGTVVVGAQRVTYTGKSTAVISPGTAIAAPTTGPTVSIPSGNGKLIGTYRYKYTRQNDTGETTGSSPSASVSPAGPALPTAPSRVATTTLGNLAGSYLYKISFVTALGETLPGTASSAVVVDEWPIPTVAPNPDANELNENGPLIGTISYKYTFVTAMGETLPSSIVPWGGGNPTPDAWPVPTGPLVEEWAESGPLAGSYLYKISNVTALGETLPGTASSAVTPDAQAAPGAIATSESASAIGPLYGGNYLWSTTFVNAFGETLKGSTTNRTPTTHAAPTFPGITQTTGGALTLLGVYKWRVTFVSEFGETTGGTGSGTITLTGSNNAAVVGSGGTLPVGPSGTIARRIYRTKNGGTEYFLATSVAGNTSTGTTDTVSDLELGQRAPDINTFGGYEVTVTGIDIGPTGTTARRIYRTKKDGSTYYLVGVIPNNTTTTFIDDVPDEALVVNEPSVNTAAGEKVRLTSIDTGPAGTIARRIYRTKAGGSQYFYVDELSDNTTTTYIDEIPDSALTRAAPLVSTAGGEKIRLTFIPVGPSGTIARRIYRTKAGGSQYFYVDELSNNTTTTYDDQIPDSALTRGVTLTATAGGHQVTLSSIDLAPAAAGVVARRIYRTKAGGSEYFYVDQLSDNTTTTYTDNVPDASLTQHPPLVNTAGGQQVLVSGLAAGPSGTIARKIYRTKNGGTSYFYLDSLDDNVTTTYTDNKPDDSLGALLPTANTTAGTAETLNTLTGIPPSGTGSIRFAIPKGEPVNILITRNSTTAQTALAALIGGDGIHEHYIQDNRLAESECIARGDAELAAFKDPIVTVTFTTRDPNATAGKAITFSLGAPTNLSGTFKIQDVTISEVGQLPGVLPLRTVTASSQRFSLEDLLRQRRGVAAWAA